MTTDDVARVARVFRALGSPVRLGVVRELARDREVSARHLRELFCRSQPTMTEHFAKLLRTGVIQIRRVGRRNYYTLNRRLLRRTGIALLSVRGSG